MQNVVFRLIGLNCWHALGTHVDDQCMGSDVSVHHRDNANKCVSAFRDAEDDRAAGSHSCLTFDQCVGEFVLAREFRVGIVDIGEVHGRTAEDAVLDRRVAID